MSPAFAMIMAWGLRAASWLAAAKWSDAGAKQASSGEQWLYRTLAVAGAILLLFRSDDIFQGRYRVWDLGLGNIDAERLERSWIGEAGGHAYQRVEGSDHESGADEQDQGKRDLHDNQGLTGAMPFTALAERTGVKNFAMMLYAPPGPSLARAWLLRRPAELLKHRGAAMFFPLSTIFRNSPTSGTSFLLK